ncbi:MAG: hypothetical protein R3C44_16500 [Chloroflexota bacterium]
MKQSYRSVYAEAIDTSLWRHSRRVFHNLCGIGLAAWTTCLYRQAVYKIEAASLFCTKPAADDDTLYPSDHVGMLVNIEV